MTLSIGARPGMNNPGDLTVPGAGDINFYTGQTGVYPSPNGLFYPKFSTPQAGFNGILDWLGWNVGTNPANSITNLNDLASYYLNGNFNGIQPNPLNPYPQQWLNTVSEASGLSPTQQITPADFPAIATGIMKAEGTYGTFAGSLNTGGNPAAYAPGTVGNWLEGIGVPPNILTGAAGIASVVTGKPQQVGGGQSVTPGATAEAAGIDLSGITKALQNFDQLVGGALSQSTWERVGVAGVAVVLIAGALILLAKNPPAPSGASA